jgi:predicted metal-dependent enzyme (double-stranded beta helix superfamily)
MHILNHDDLVARIARAVESERVAELAAVLAAMHESGAFGAELFLPARASRYVRKLIHRDPGGRFIVAAMTWAPGQGSTLHDHAGLWGAEIVVEGAMSETMYALHARGEDGRYRFARGSHRVNAAGMVGVLMPPLEYHDFRNVGEGIACTLHVYGGDLTSSQLFYEEDDGWWSARGVELHYDG